MKRTLVMMTAALVSATFAAPVVLAEETPAITPGVGGTPAAVEVTGSDDANSTVVKQSAKKKKKKKKKSGKKKKKKKRSHG